MTTATEHINELLSGENLSLKDQLETAQACYNDLVEAIESNLQEYIFDTDVAAVAIYCDAIERAAKDLPGWKFLKEKGYPEEGQLVIVAFINPVNGTYEVGEAKWEDGEWGTNYSCLELDTENVYAWTEWMAPPQPLDD